MGQMAVLGEISKRVTGVEHVPEALETRELWLTGVGGGIPPATPSVQCPPRRVAHCPRLALGIRLDLPLPTDFTTSTSWLGHCPTLGTDLLGCCSPTPWQPFSRGLVGGGCRALDRAHFSQVALLPWTPGILLSCHHLPSSVTVSQALAEPPTWDKAVVQLGWGRLTLDPQSGGQGPRFF